MLHSLRFYVLPIGLSLLLHAGVITLLMVSWSPAPEARKISTPRYIEAKLVELKPKAKQASAKKQPKIVDLTAKKREREKQQRLAEQKRQQEIKKREEAAAKRAAEKKRLAEEERKRLAEQQKQLEAQRQQRAQQEFEQALMEEEGLLLEDEYATEAQSYADVIRRRIEQNWSRPPSARNGMRCELTIDMVPNGRIIDVNIKTSSGNLAFDRSALAAVKKVEQIPEVKDIPIEIFERHFRTFSLGFQPEDLRQ